MLKYLLIVVILFSCNPLRHYQKVATDTRVSEEKKAVLAPWVHLNFPVVPQYIPGRSDTITITLPGDTLSTIEYLQDTIIITKTLPRQIVTIHRVDTITKESTAVVDALRRQLSTAGAVETSLRYDLDKRQEQLKASRKWFYLFLAACAVIVTGVVLRIKSII